MCDRFPPGAKVPHVGWNSIRIKPQSRLMAGLLTFVRVLHAHLPRSGGGRNRGVTEYGDDFSGAVERDNVMGVQFHPEKSGEAGLQILRNFLEVTRC